MKALLASLQDSLRSLGRGLRVPGLYLVLVASAVLWAIAYQYKTAYTVDVGGRGDDAYVSGFHAKERNPDLDYRWSGSSSSVRFPAVGNQPIVVSITTVGHRPEGEPPTVTVRVREQTFEIRTAGVPRTESREVERGDPLQGDAVVEISSPTFTPAGDPRVLGVIVDKVTITPAGYGLRPFVMPPIGAVMTFLGGLALIYVIALVTLRSVAWALAAIMVLGAVAATLIVVARPELGLLSENLLVLCLWGLVLAFAGRAFLDSVVDRARPETLRAVGWGSAAFAIAFLIRYGGLTYPQFLSSDVLLHAHNILSVLRGEWVFPESLPDGTPVPYPNALYLVLAPFALILGSSDSTLSLLLKWSGALFDSATCLALAWALSRVWSPRVGALAALAYAVSPAPFVLFSAGNYANIFGQAAQNATVLGGLVFLGRRTSLSAATAGGLLAVGFALTVLGHYGIMLATLVLVGVFVVWAVWSAVQGRNFRVAWTLAGAFALSLAASVFLYYRHFAEEMWNQWSGVLARVSGAAPTRDGSSQLEVGSLLGGILGRIVTWIGALASLCGLFGATFLGRMPTPARALLVAWLLACALFALLDQALGDAIRWYYLAAAPVSLLAGGFLAPLTSRGFPPRVLTVLVFLALLTQLLVFWVGELIFGRYH